MKCIFTGRNEVVAKVMFLHVSVILLTRGGVSGEPPRPRRTPPGPGRPPRDQGEPPPGRTLQHTVNERLVRILLECIVVVNRNWRGNSNFPVIHKVGHVGIFIQLLWLRQVSNPRPLAHQSSILLLSQKSRLRLGGNTTLLPLFLRAWYSHWQDITGYFPTNPQVKTSKPHWPLNPQCWTTLGHHASACIWANTSDTKCCDSTEFQTHNLCTQSSILPLSQKSGLRLGGDTTQLPIQICICHCAWK